MAKSDETQLKILRTSERLFSERGVEAVSLREIARAAGQRNHSAVLYHFGDKQKLIEALLKRHSDPVDRMLGASLAGPSLDLRGLIQVLVFPLVEKLDDPDGGADYLQICAQLSTSRTFPLTALEAANGPGSLALRQRLLEHLPVPPELVAIRLMQTAILLFGSLACYRQLREAGLGCPTELFAADLVDALIRNISAKQPTSIGRVSAELASRKNPLGNQPEQE